MKPTLFMCAVMVGHCSSEPDAATAITYRASDGVNPPILVQQVAPVYSEDARKAKFQHIVRVALVVGLDGRPENLEVVQVAGLGLDEQTVEAVRLWRFKPGTKAGQAVRVEANVEANFRMRGWRVTSLEYDTPPNASLPLPTLRFLPLWGETCGEVNLVFQIPTNGVPANLRVLRSTNELMSEAATESVKGWRFRPAKQDDSPVPSNAELVMSCEPWLTPSR
jgi:TonB family protein